MENLLSVNTLSKISRISIIWTFKVFTSIESENSTVPPSTFLHGHGEQLLTCARLQPSHDPINPSLWSRLVVVTLISAALQPFSHMYLLCAVAKLTKSDLHLVNFLSTCVVMGMSSCKSARSVIKTAQINGWMGMVKWLLENWHRRRCKEDCDWA